MRDSYHHGDLRATLVAAALELVESGEPFSLRAVARAAGVSQAAPYRHFPDRDHLEAAVAVTGLRDLEARLREVLADRGAGPADVGLEYVRFALERPALFRLMFAEACDPVDDERVAGTSALHSIVDEAVARRTPGPGAALAGWALAHGLAMLHLDGTLPGDGVEVRVRSAFAALA